MTNYQDTPTDRLTRRAHCTEAIAALVYFAVYLGYLFVNQETEFMHWLTLVALPLGSIILYQRGRDPAWRLRRTLASIGVNRSNLSRGLLLTAAVALLLSSSQLFISNRRDEIWGIINRGEVLWLLPLTLVILLLTAGFTEEFFFRGIVQTRLENWCGSKLWSVLATSLMFSLYHEPYAYFDPDWSSHGSWPDAFAAAFTAGMLGGIVLGWLYVKTRRNLLACVVLHVFLNAFPGMVAVKKLLS